MSFQGKLSGCDIKSYLFEKSRITQQQEVERSYHIFYQMLQPAVPDLKVRTVENQFLDITPRKNAFSRTLSTITPMSVKAGPRCSYLFFCNYFHSTFPVSHLVVEITWSSSRQVDSIDDNEELQFTDTAFDIIGFSETEKWNCYKVRAGQIRIRIFFWTNIFLNIKQFKMRFIPRSQQRSWQWERWSSSKREERSSASLTLKTISERFVWKTMQIKMVD